MQTQVQRKIWAQPFKTAGDFMAQEKKQSFMKGAAILSASTLLVKILGLLFSIPLANIIEPSAMSY